MGLASFNRARRLAAIKSKEENQKKCEENIEKMKVKDLKEKCKELGLTEFENLKKEELIELLKATE